MDIELSPKITERDKENLKNPIRGGYDASQCY